MGPPRKGRERPLWAIDWKRGRAHGPGMKPSLKASSRKAKRVLVYVTNQLLQVLEWALIYAGEAVWATTDTVSRLPQLPALPKAPTGFPVCSVYLDR